MQLVKLLRRQAAQGAVDQLRQLRLVAAAGHAQQQGKADVADHRQFAEFLQARQAAELGFVGHGERRGLVEHLLQCRLFVDRGAQVEVAEVAAQVGQHRAVGGHGDQAAGLQRIQFHRAGVAAFANHQMRHAQVGVGVLPQAQAGGGLQQAGGEVDGAGLEGGLQLVLAGIVLPLPADAERLAQPLHQFHVGPGQTLLAAVELGVGWLQDNAHPQRSVGLQPGALGLRQRQRRGSVGPCREGEQAEKQGGETQQHGRDLVVAMTLSISEAPALSDPTMVPVHLPGTLKPAVKPCRTRRWRFCTGRESSSTMTQKRS